MSDCFVPQIVYSTTFGYRTDNADWGGKEPTSVCAIFDLEGFPGKRSLEKRPINNLEWALYCDGVPLSEVYDVLSSPEGVERALGSADEFRRDVVPDRENEDEDRAGADSGHAQRKIDAPERRPRRSSERSSRAHV